jgi:hypothetical protein
MAAPATAIASLTGIVVLVGIVFILVAARLVVSPFSVALITTVVCVGSRGTVTLLSALFQSFMGLQRLDQPLAIHHRCPYPRS